ncbi:MAG: phosphatidate cytidylyltransferase [Bacteroidetes bacterium]|nr:MAG: phosphatidate cytidylyltransferase [Bacteroidota bacterium]
MAFNWQTFKTRSLTAIIFVVVMLLGLLWNQWSFFILFSIIHFGCWFEYQRIIGLIDKGYLEITPLHKYGVMIAGWALMLYFTNNSYLIGDLRLHAIGWWLCLLFAFVLPIIEILFARHMNLRNIGYSALGLIYISLSWSLMIGLRSIPDAWMSTGGKIFNLGLVIPLTVIFSIWINDTMAYIVGSLIGKTPLSSISPKKTWEGTIGGILLCIATIGLIAYLLGLSVGDACVIAAISAIFGTLGDLLESKLKRMANVKDSGHIMPGHGGFLDRFDSLLIATPVVWIYVKSFVL